MRTWLACEGRIGPAAAELGISVPGARKRLTRLETVFQRSLLRPRAPATTCGWRSGPGNWRLLREPEPRTTYGPCPGPA
ncbi:helix-turn-helix domain-containing protein [Streptomyces cavourensis]